MSAAIPRTIWRWIAVSAAFALTSIACPTLAMDARFELAWAAPAECPDQLAIERRLEQLLGAPAGTLATRQVRVQAIVVERGDLYELTLRSEVADAQPGRRELAADSCEELAAAGAVIIALLINPEALSAHAPSEPETVANGMQPKASGGVQPHAPARASEPVGTGPAHTGRPSTAAPPRVPSANLPRLASEATHDHGATLTAPAWFLGAAALADLGSLPSAAPGVQVLIGAQWSRVRVEAGALFLPARFAGADDDPNKGGSISLWAAAAQSCFALLADEVSFGPCAGVEVGSLRGKGRGLRDADDDQVPWLAVIAGLQLAVPLRQGFSVRLQGLASVPLARSTFYYLREDGGTEPLHRPSAVVGRLGIGLEMAF